MPFVIPAIIGAAGSIGGGAIASYGAGQAAQTQATAAEKAAQLEAQSQKNALDFEKQVWGQQQANAAPWVSAGQGAVGQLQQLLATPGQGLTAPYPGGQFQAPTGVTEQNDPGYQFRLQQGQLALERLASAKGNLLTGGTGKALTRYGQDYASNEFANVYSRSLQDYMTNYNVWSNQQANTYNRYAGLAGLGQTAAAQLGTQGSQAAGQVAQTTMQGAQAQAQAIQNAAAATASGYVGQANAWSGALGSLSNLGYLPLYSQMLNSQGILNSGLLNQGYTGQNALPVAG